jgi:lipoyl(octanoyl) transferase
VPTLLWCYLGRVAYDAARALQTDLAATRAAGRHGDLLLLLEHPAVLTIGRYAPLPATGGLPVVRTDRGGKLTYHGPGQLIGYPVVALRSAGRGVREFVCRLESALCDTAQAFGVVARSLTGLPGVWTGPAEEQRKLASIGLAVRRGVTLHGCALNLDARAECGFAGLDPCGLPGARVTSLAGAGATPVPSSAAAAETLANALARRLGLDAARVAPDEPPFSCPAATRASAEVALPHGHQPAP